MPGPYIPIIVGAGFIPPLRPAELGEAVLVDAEVVRDLVDDRDPDLLLEHLGFVAELLFERDSVDRDLVGQGSRIALAPVHERHAEIEAVQVRVLWVLVLDDDLDVRHRRPKLGRQRLECAPDVVLEGQYAGRSGRGRPAAKSRIAANPKTKPPMWAK